MPCPDVPRVPLMCDGCYGDRKIKLSVLDEGKCLCDECIERGIENFDDYKKYLERNQMFSQNNEEQHILEYFDGWTDGRFLDLGAYNGKTFSNTHALALKGWKGVCVEASAKPFHDLTQLYKDNQKIELVNAMVIPDTEDARFLLEFYDAGGDAISTCDEDHRKKWENDRVYSRVWMPPVYMSHIERRFGTEFDFINIDLEGINFDVMMGIIDWDPAMICIEHDEDHYRTKQVKEIMGLEEIYRNGENVILARKKNDEESETKQIC